MILLERSMPIKKIVCVLLLLCISSCSVQSSKSVQPSKYPGLYTNKPKKIYKPIQTEFIEPTNGPIATINLIKDSDIDIIVRSISDSKCLRSHGVTSSKLASLRLDEKKEIKVRANKQLVLDIKVEDNALFEPARSCSITLKFIPENSKNYDLKVSTQEIKNNYVAKKKCIFQIYEIITNNGVIEKRPVNFQENFYGCSHI